MDMHHPSPASSARPHPAAPGDKRLRLGTSLKLLFAALGAGGRVVPMGDNGHTTRLLANYAASLRDR